MLPSVLEKSCGNPVLLGIEISTEAELNAGWFRWPFFFLLAMPGKNGKAM